MFLTFIEGFIEVELMVTKRDDDDDRRQGEYRAICLWKMDWQSFAIPLIWPEINLRYQMGLCHDTRSRCFLHVPGAMVSSPYE